MSVESLDSGKCFITIMKGAQGGTNLLVMGEMRHPYCHLLTLILCQNKVIQAGPLWVVGPPSSHHCPRSEHLATSDVHSIIYW